MEAVAEIRKNINGEMLTLDETVNKNIKLIWSVAKRYINYNRHLEPNEIFSICSIGMINAFNRFDPEKFPVKFSTYAVPMMKGEMHRYLRDHGSDLKFPRSVIDVGNKIINQGMREESIETLMLHYDESEKDIKRALAYVRNRHSTSLQVETGSEGDGGTTLEDTIGDQRLADYSVAHVDDFLNTLSDVDRKIIELTMSEWTQKEIAKEVGVSQVQISRIIQKLYPLVEKFFGYPIGYFSNRKFVSMKGEKKVMVKKDKPRDQKGDLERAKELLKTTDMTPCSIAKETGIGDGSAYYWANKIREPQLDEEPVVVSKIEVPDLEISAVDLDADIAARKDDNDEWFYNANKAQIETGYTVNIDEELENKRNNLINKKSKKRFYYGIDTSEVSPSDLHTLFTQVGHAASASGIDKLNVSVTVTNEKIKEVE